MEIQILIAVIFALPVLLLPFAALWHMNIGGVPGKVKKAMSRHNSK